MTVRELSDVLRQRLPQAVLRPMQSARRQIEELRYGIFRLRVPTPVRVKQPVFLIGCPRSGTSLTVRLFGRHPELANWSEAGEFWDPEHYYDEEADHHWGVERATPEEIDRLHHRFEFVRRAQRKPRFLNKHPRNSMRIDFLEAVFPDARYVHVIRDGRAVAMSICKRLSRHPNRPQSPLGQFVRPPNWRDLRRDDPLEEAILLWREIVTHIGAKRSLLGDRYHEIRYEGLCQRPQEVLARAFAFLGVRDDEAVVREVVAEQLSSHNYKYRRALPPEKVDLMNRLAGDLLAELGYAVP